MSKQAIGRLEDFRADVRRWGWLRSLFSRAVSRLERLAGLHIHWILIRDLVGSEVAPHRPDGIVVRVVHAEELLTAAGDSELSMDSQFVHRALARGDMAFGGFDGDRLVGYVWRAFVSVPHAEGVWVKFDPPYHYGYKAFTRTSYRGRRILVAVALFSDSYLLLRGRVAQVSNTHICNFASLAAQKTAGARKIGLAGYVKLFGLVVSFRTPAVGKIGFAFYSRR